MGAWKDFALFCQRHGLNPESLDAFDMYMHRVEPGTPCPHCGREMRQGYCFYCDHGGRPQKTELQRAKDEARALQLWDDALPISGTMAERYLREHRKITIVPPDVNSVLRFHPGCPFGGPRSFFPCMLALVRDISSATHRPCGVHRTPLDPVHGKIAPPRALGTFYKCAIKLWPTPDHGRLTIGEGIETTLSAVQLMPKLAPAWAVGTAGNVGMFPILDDVHELRICADKDPVSSGRIGQVKAKQCAERYGAFGKLATIHTPRKRGHKDFNDVVKELAA